MKKREEYAVIRDAVASGVVDAKELTRIAHRAKLDAVRRAVVEVRNVAVIALLERGVQKFAESDPSKTYEEDVYTGLRVYSTSVWFQAKPDKLRTLRRALRSILGEWADELHTVQCGQHFVGRYDERADKDGYIDILEAQYKTSEEVTLLNHPYTIYIGVEYPEAEIPPGLIKDTCRIETVTSKRLVCEC